MAARGQLDHLAPAADLPLDRLHLGHRAVFVVLALDREHRTADRGQEGFDVPATEIGMQPDVVPTVEAPARIGVVARELLRELGRLEGGLGFGDALHRNVLDEDVRGEHYQPRQAVARAGVDERDRRAIGVSDQHRLPDREPGEEFGQRLERLAMHVVDGEGRFEQVGLAVPVARVHDRRTARRLRHKRGELFPQRNRAKALVQEDERRPARIAREALDLQAMAARFDEGPLGLRQAGLRETIVDIVRGMRVARLPDGREVECLNRAEVDFLYAEIFAREVYLKHGLDLPDGATVVDAGANVGLFSLWAARRARGAAIHAVEPIPEVFAVLERNAARLFPQASLYQVALGGGAGTARLAYYPRATGWSTRAPAPDAVRESLRAYALQQRSWPIARWLARRPRLLALATRPLFRSEARECRVTTLSALVDGAPIDLLKIDVEGSESDVLDGIAATHWPRIRQITLETDAGRVGRIVASLRTRGYAVVAEEPASLTGTGFRHVYARRARV